jgi:glycosyltransferase involved in cell wall biosynthesis
VKDFSLASVIEHDLNGNAFQRWRRRRFDHPRDVARITQEESGKSSKSILHISDQEQAHLVPHKSPIPVSVTVHDLFHLRPRKVKSSYGIVNVGKNSPGFIRSMDLKHIRKGLQRADLLICISEATALEVRELWPNKAVSVLPHAIDVEGYNPYSYPLPKPVAVDYDQVNLLYVGSEEPRKRLDFLVEVLGHLPSDVRERVVLHKVGAESSPKKCRELRAKASSYGVAINWEGKISDTELYSFYQHCDALLFPSLAEGFGLPPLEAMASGCPVRSANRPAHNEVAPEPWLLPYDTLDSWVDSVIEIAESALKRGRRQPCEIALSHSTNFSIRNWASKIHEAWSNITK